jgi:hypothetical protein
MLTYNLLSQRRASGTKRKSKNSPTEMPPFRFCFVAGHDCTPLLREQVGNIGRDGVCAPPSLIPNLAIEKR